MRIKEALPLLPRAIALTIAAGLATTLALSAPRPVKADNDGRGRGCSESTLRGDYGFSIDADPRRPARLPVAWP
jgi:hypothetical protein